MYSTKVFNKNCVPGNAYITVGDPYQDHNFNPFRAPKKGDNALNPFRTTVSYFLFLKKIRIDLIVLFISQTKPQNSENGYFTKRTYVSDPYKETNKYINSQPLDSRKNGFGTKDAHRRDEFSNTIRTEQYRETLRKEQKLNKDSSENINQKLTTLLNEREKNLSESNATLNQTKSLFRSTMMTTPNGRKIHQYDIGRNRVTEFDPRSSKDTFYRFDPQFDKTFGNENSSMVNKPVSTEIGATAWSVTYKPPTFGGKSEVKNFFDKSHLNVVPL